MKKLPLLIVLIAMFAMYSCESYSGETLVTGLADTTTFTAAEKETFRGAKSSVSVVNIHVDDSTQLTTKAAIFTKDLEGKTFPFKATFHSGDGFCGCDMPYVDVK
ncbi:MAG: hypothetical protein KBC67_00825 [Candidatus Pacebacteria bacterium]|nr:hypothetical protein [Candidatus Paceibacterota bacterium]